MRPPEAAARVTSASPLRRRLLVSTLAAVVPLVLLAGWLAFRAAHAALDAELGRRLASVAGLLADQFTTSGDAGRIARLEADSERIRARLGERLVVARDATGLRRVRIVDPGLNTLVDTEGGEPFVPAFDLEADRPELYAVLARQGAQASVLFEAADGTRVKRGWAAVFYEDRPVAAVVVEANADYFALLVRYRNAMLLLALVVVALIALVAHSVARRVTRPLTELEAAARRLGTGDLSVPIEVTEAGEVGALGAALENARSRLAARDEDMQMMLAGIAHEVRNPLGGIELYAGLLDEELQGDERQGHVSRIRRELGHLNAVVTSFLSFARERPLEIVRLSTRELLDPVSACVSELATNRGVVVATEVGEGAEQITVDAEQARSALQNVVQNAVQACGQGGRVDVLARRRGDAVQLSVSDTGVGIAPEQMRDVFRAFYTTREKGTGLGLPLVRKTMDRHGGSVTLQSSPGQGTTFVLTFPLRHDAPTQAATGCSRHSDDDQFEMIG